MPIIRIPPQHWGEVWRVLTAADPITRIAADNQYEISLEQIRLLKDRNLPFQLIEEPLARDASVTHA